jgi:hypothetical protein
MQIKLVVAGSRTVRCAGYVFQAIDEYLEELGVTTEDQVEIVSGMASNGPDVIAVWYAQERGYPLKEFPANWDELGKGAGMLRNSDMARYATHALIIWDGQSNGTKDMMSKAAQYHLKTRILQRPVLKMDEYYESKKGYSVRGLNGRKNYAGQSEQRPNPKRARWTN